VSGGVEPKAEIASSDEMNELSKHPGDDQEKNQYTELFIDKNKGVYIQKGDKETDQLKYLNSWKWVN